MRPRTLFAILPLALGLMGCAALEALDDASQPLEIYELRSLEAAQGAAGGSGSEVVVEEPIASGALDTERIMIRPAPLRAQYLPGVRWADTAPAMMQTLMLRSLSATGAFASVGRRPIGTMADFAVLSELTDFQAEAEDVGATVRIRLLVRLVREREARVIATRAFAVTEAAANMDADTIADAFDRAAGRLQGELVAWVLARSGGTR